MTKLTEGKTKDTEAMILRAAEEEFVAKGYNGARTTAIAEKAGVSHAMLHYYFRTKNKLFQKIVSDKMSGVANIMLTAFGDEALPLYDRVRDGVEKHFDYVLANSSLPRFIFQQVESGEDFASVLHDTLVPMAGKLLTGLQRQIDESAEKGECRPLRAENLILDIVSLNLFPILFAPVIKVVLADHTTDMDDFYRRRKEENVNTIWNKLRP